jgi:hypothetical protein
VKITLLKKWINNWKNKKAAINQMIEIQNTTFFLSIYYLNSSEKHLCFDLYNLGESFAKDFTNILLEVFESLLNSYNVLYLVKEMSNKNNCETIPQNTLLFSSYKTYYDDKLCNSSKFFSNGLEFIELAKSYSPNLINFYYKNRVYEDRIYIYGYKILPFKATSFEEIKSNLDKHEYDIYIKFSETEGSVLSIELNAEKFNKDYVFSTIQNICNKYDKILDVNIE